MTVVDSNCCCCGECLGTMAEAPPSLISLCIDALAQQFLRPSDDLPSIYDLPSHLLHTLITRLPPFALRTFHRHHLYTFPHSTNSNFKRSLFSLLSNRFLLCVETDHSTRKGFLATTPRRRENAQGWLVALAHNFLLLPSFL